MNNRVIRNYLESLKEDDELDFIFPILLESMGFQVVSTPKCTKGQPQYGKDVIAIGPDSSGIKYKWYFELKGHAAKDITDETFNGRDGFRESIQASKDVDYTDSTIPGFNELPRKIVFVHNGIVKGNTQHQLDSFISKEFSNGEFERWDIDKLTNLFQTYLFDECLYRDDNCYLLVKKILVLYDAPGWDLSHLDELVDNLLAQCSELSSKSRKMSMNFSAIALILAILFKECLQVNNLSSAKKASDCCVLKVWAWILKNEKNNDNTILKLYATIVNIQLKIYSTYLQKLLPLAIQFKGLYMPNGLETERIMFPLRCFDFIEDVIYFHIMARNYIVDTAKLYNFDKKGVETVMSVIKNNSGFDIPLLDTHSIPILLVFHYIYNFSEKYEDYAQDLAEWISRITLNIIIRKKDDDMFPELYGSRKELAKSLYKKSSSYNDRSSLFLLILTEILYHFDMDDLYNDLRQIILEKNVNLQVSYPVPSDDLEVHLFTQNLHKELYVETNIKLPKKIKDLPDCLKKEFKSNDLKTNHSPFPFLLYLAHTHYNSDWFPDFVNFGFLLKNDKE